MKTLKRRSPSLWIGLVALMLARGGADAASFDRSSAARMLPADTILLVHVDLAALRSSPLYLRLDPHVGRYVTSQGLIYDRAGLFDLEKDLDALTIGFGSDLETVYVVLRGRFPRATLEAAARASGAFTEELRGDVRILRLRGTEGGSRNSGQGALETYAALGDDTLLVTSDRSFPSLLDAALGNGPNALDSPGLGELLGRSPPGQITFDVRLTEEARKRLGEQPAPLWGGPMDALSSLESVAAGLVFGEGLELFVQGTVTSAGGGQRLYDMAGGWLALGKMFVANPEWSSALSKLRLELDGTNLRMKLSLTAAEAEQLLK